MESSNTCRNCGSGLSGPFCSQCGQSVRDGHAPKLSHFFHDLVHETLHVDGKIFRTLKALFFQPGRLTAEFWDGRAGSWIRPLRLFLIVAAIHLLTVHHTVGPVNYRVSVLQDAKGNRNVTVSQRPNSIVRPGFSPLPRQQQDEFFEQFRKSYISIRYLSVLFLAFASWLVYRNLQPYFVNHLLMGLHYYAFWYALSILGSLDPILSNITVLLSLVYLLLAVRRLFGQSWGKTIAKGVLLFAVLLLIEGSLAYSAAIIAERSWATGSGLR